MLIVMFIRSVKVPSSNGTVHEYVRIVGSVRLGGKVKQKVIANLGRRDTLEAVLPMLNRFLKGDDDEDLAAQLAQEGTIKPLDASTWGPSLVVRRAVRHDILEFSARVLAILPCRTVKFKHFSVEFAPWREEAIMDLMITTTRTLQRYDHRLRELVRSTGNVDLAIRHGVPRSTARGWLTATGAEVVTVDIVESR
jgi:hypothetical protein